MVQYIFPHLEIQKIPDDGDCYYSSVGKSMGLNSLKVRQDLAVGFAQLSSDDKGITVDGSIFTCPDNAGLGLMYKQDRNKLIQDFPKILTEKCGEGKMDCYECVWGGSFLDEITLMVYKAPVISIAILPGSEDKQHKISIKSISQTPELEKFITDLLNVLNPTFWEPKTSSMSFPIIEKIISISMTPIANGSEEVKLLDSHQSIMYIIDAGKHVDAVIPKK